MSIFSQRLEQIRSNVFIICPNNSGSTLLKRLLETSPHFLSLKREGQFAFGFKGPVCREVLEQCKNHPFKMEPLTWAASDLSVRYIRDARKYDWEANQKSWYLQATGSAPDTACMYLEKTPYFLLITEELRRFFTECRFIFMVRNPYAAIQGVVKRENMRPFLNNPNVDLAKHSALHFLTCLRVQKQNLTQFPDQSCLLRYEDLCDRPDLALNTLKRLLPEVQELDLQAEVQVKHYPARRPTNMNATHIENLTSAQISSINSVFEPERALLAEFGYDLIG